MKEFEKAYSEPITDIRCIRMLRCWWKMRFQFFCSRVCPKSVFLQTMYLGCAWKCIRSSEQNAASERSRVSLYSVKVIKMSRLTINRFFILWALHALLRNRLHFAFRNARRRERGQLRCAWNSWDFYLRLSARVITSEIFLSASGWKHANRPNIV